MTPEADRDEAQVSGAGAPAVAGNGSASGAGGLEPDRIVVLNVDDYEAGRYATTRILSRAGFEVVEAAGGMQALELAARQAPDLVVLDVNLPDIDGFEVCRRLKARPETAAVPVLYLSAAYRQTEHRVQGLEMGADAYLTQPVEPRELVATVNALLRARSIRDAVRMSEERYRSLMESMARIVWTTNETGEFDAEQPGWSSFTGQTFEELRGWGWLAAVHPDDRAATAAAWKSAVEGRTPYAIEHRLRRHDGEYRYMHARGVAVLEPDGSVREWVGAHTDITDRRWAEDAQRLLIDASRVFSSSLDYETTLESVARVAVPLLADTCVVHVGEDATETDRVLRFHVGPDGETRVSTGDDGARSHAQEAMSSGEPVFLPDAPGEFVSLISLPLIARGHTLGAISFIMDESGRRYSTADLALARELASRAALAMDNARLYKEAQQANQAKADFIAVTSHELRTPMNAILGYVDLLGMGIGGALNPAQLEHVDRIGRSARHLLGIIEEILTFSQVEAGSLELNLEKVDIAEVILDVAALIEPLALASGLGFRMQLPEDGVRLETDPHKLRQILFNLLGNAVKFTESGEIVVAATLEDGAVELQVVDTGIGIPQEHLDKIFDPFWQVNQRMTRTRGGTGLGLTVTRQLVDLLGGTIVVHSHSGAGSTFTISLPLRWSGKESLHDG